MIKLVLFFSFGLLCVLRLSAQPQAQPQAQPHPQSQSAIDTAAGLENNPGVYSIIVAQNDRIIYRRYFKGYDSATLFSEQSLTKSICSLLIGIAIDKGYLSSVDEKLVDIFPELKKDADPRKSEITIRAVMNQASGLWHENLKSPFGIHHFLKQKDPAGYVLKQPLAGEPGKEWHYNNAASYLLSAIITRATHMDIREFAIKYLFAPLNITEFRWLQMRDGTYDGSGLKGIFLRSADLLKIGELFLHNGVYDNRQVVPKKWVQLILDPDITYPSTWGFEGSTYALDYYHAVYHGTAFLYGMGWGGQFVVILPSLKAIVVINENAANKQAIERSETFIRRIFPAILAQLSKIP